VEKQNSEKEKTAFYGKSKKAAQGQGAKGNQSQKKGSPPLSSLLEQDKTKEKQNRPTKKDKGGGNPDLGPHELNSRKTRGGGEYLKIT